MRTIMMDMEFEKVKDQEGMELVDINTTGTREPVGEIERGIRYLKECSRCSVRIFAVAGIKYLAKPIVICLVCNVTLFVNAISDTLGVSEQYSPREIVTQSKLEFKRHCNVQFGAHVQYYCHKYDEATYAWVRCTWYVGELAGFNHVLRPRQSEGRDT